MNLRSSHNITHILLLLSMPNLFGNANYSSNVQSFVIKTFLLCVACHEASNSPKWLPCENQVKHKKKMYFIKNSCVTTNRPFNTFFFLSFLSKYAKCCRVGTCPRKGLKKDNREKVHGSVQPVDLRALDGARRRRGLWYSRHDTVNYRLIPLPTSL